MLGDCHIHMLLDGVYYKDAIAAHRGHVRDDLIRERLSAYRRAGILYLRDGGDAFHVAERAALLSGEYGIEYRTPLFPIYLKGRYGGFIGRAFETIGDYRQLVQEVKQGGGDFIKLMISGLMDFNQFGRITSEPLAAAQLREMVRIAHGEGFAVMAHANGAETVLNALDAGVDSIEHGAYLNDEAIRALARSDAVWVPTLVTVGNLLGEGRYPDEVLRPLLELQMANVGRCARLGGSIALGSDSGAYQVFHARGTLDEYALLKRAIGDGVDNLLQASEEKLRLRFRRG